MIFAISSDVNNTLLWLVPYLGYPDLANLILNYMWMFPVLSYRFSSKWVLEKKIFKSFLQINFYSKFKILCDLIATPRDHDLNKLYSTIPENFSFSGLFVFEYGVFKVLSLYIPIKKSTPASAKLLPQLTLRVCEQT